MKKSKFEIEAKKMAERLDQAAALGEQLSFLASPDGESGSVVPAEKKAGRPKGSKNKVESQMRQMLAARGMRMPEDVLAEMAGLNSREDVMLDAMAWTERVLAWAADGAAEVGKKDAKRAWEASGSQRLSAFFEVYKMRVKVLEVMLPYGLGKVTPDQNVNQNNNITQIVMPAGAPAPAVIEGTTARRMAPPPMPKDIEQNQELSNSSTDNGDHKARTE